MSEQPIRGAQYHTTPFACSCADWKYRGAKTKRWCKHIRSQRCAKCNAIRMAHPGLYIRTCQHEEMKQESE